jgi:hypothetical protein
MFRARRSPLTHILATQIPGHAGRSTARRRDTAGHPFTRPGDSRSEKFSRTA